MSFDIIFCNLHPCPMYYAFFFEIHIKNIIGIEPCIHSQKMLRKTKKKLHEKIWMLPHAPWYKNMCKKKPMEIMNVYGLLVSAWEEEDLPYLSPPPPLTTTTTTTMNLFNPSS